MIRVPLLLDLPEIIETSRLLLQMPQAGFGERMHEAIIDGYEDYIRWLNWELEIPTIQSVEEECRKHHAEFILRNTIRYIIIEKETHQIVGRCAFPSFQTNWRIPQFGISYFIRRSQRGKGYATQSANIMVRLAFKVLKARKVEIYCDSENIASCRIPEKLKFELEYIQRGGWPRSDEKLAELRTYSLFTDENLPKLEISW